MFSDIIKHYLRGEYRIDETHDKMIEKLDLLLKSGHIYEVEYSAYKKLVDKWLEHPSVSNIQSIMVFSGYYRPTISNEDMKDNPESDKSVDNRHHDPCDYPDEDGHHTCPYSDDPTGETCRNYCGIGVDE